jgi:hypothetical protein
MFISLYFFFLPSCSELREWQGVQLTDALAEARAEEEAVDGEAVEALLDLGPPLGDGGLVEELEPPERAGGAGDAPVQPGGPVPVPAEQRRERHRGALAPGRDAPEGPELGREPAGAGRRAGAGRSRSAASCASGATLLTLRTATAPSPAPRTSSVTSTYSSSSLNRVLRRLPSVDGLLNADAGGGPAPPPPLPAWPDMPTQMKLRSCKGAAAARNVSTGQEDSGSRSSLPYSTLQKEQRKTDTVVAIRIARFSRTKTSSASSSSSSSFQMLIKCDSNNKAT